MVEESQKKASAEEFGQAATALLDEVASVMAFSERRESHPDWPALERSLPARFRKPFKEWKEAQRADSDARWEYEQSLQGTWYDNRIEEAKREPAAARRALEENLRQTRARRAKAEAAVKKVEQSWAKVLNKKATKWLRKHVHILGDRRRTGFSQHIACVCGRSREGGAAWRSLTSKTTAVSGVFVRLLRAPKWRGACRNLDFG